MLLGVCSPAHIGVQLGKVPPGAVQQCVEHHLDNNLVGEERAMKKEGHETQGAASAPHSPIPNLHNNSNCLLRAHYISSSGLGVLSPSHTVKLYVYKVRK